MKSKYIIAGIAIIALSVVAWVSLADSSIEYTDLTNAKRLGKTVQVVGTWVKGGGMNYDAQNNIFSFDMRDEKGSVIPVRLHGAKPNNFEIAQSIVVKGRVENGALHASNVLTKCPSKYESGPQQTAGGS